MDKYRRVEKSKTADAEAQPVAANEIRITQTGKVRSYISYANGLFADKQEQSVVLKAMGNAISKAVTVAEILKHRVAHLHQITQISSIETVDVYEPLEEGLDRIETKRHIPSISITLSLKQLNTSDPGYQSPIPVEMVSTTPFDEQEHKKTRKLRNKRPTKSDSPAPEEDPAAAKSGKPSAAAVSAAVEQEESSSGPVARDSNNSNSKRGRGGRGGRGSARGGRKPGAGRGENNKSGTDSDVKAEPAKQQTTTDSEAAPAAPARKTKPRKQRPAVAVDSSDANGENSEKENKASSNQSADPTEHTPTKSHTTSTRGGRGGRGYTRGRGRGRGRGSAGRGNDATAEQAPAAAAAASADN